MRPRFPAAAAEPVCPGAPSNKRTKFAVEKVKPPFNATTTIYNVLADYFDRHEVAMPDQMLAEMEAGFKAQRAKLVETKAMEQDQAAYHPLGSLVAMVARGGGLVSTGEETCATAAAAAQPLALAPLPDTLSIDWHAGAGVGSQADL
jgi:hypothetical protein